MVAISVRFPVATTIKFGDLPIGISLATGGGFQRRMDTEVSIALLDAIFLAPLLFQKQLLVVTPRRGFQKYLSAGCTLSSVFEAEVAAAFVVELVAAFVVQLVAAAFVVELAAAAFVV